MIRKSGKKRHRAEIWPWCRSLRALKQIHGLMVVRGFLSDPSALRELIFCSAISLPGAMHYALELFDQIPHPDLSIWNTIIRGAAHTSTPLDAVYMFTRMDRSGTRPNKLTFPFLLRACTKLSSSCLGSQLHAKILKLGLGTDIYIKTALINLHANCGDFSVAMALFDRTARRDVVAWSSLIAGLANRGQLDVARQMFDEMPFKDLVSWNVMITGYVKQGDMESARELFDEVPQRDVVSWNAMITGYVRCGAHQEAMKVFVEMRQARERPDEVTMLSLLSACSDSGALDVGEKIHQSLVEIQSRNELSVVLGNALIDMYAKCGSINKALEVFSGMREKDVSTWNSIIGGLAFHGHAEESVSLFEHMRKKRVKPNEITFVGVLVACSHGGMVEEGHKYFKLMRTEYGIEPNVKHYGCMVDILGRAGLLEEASNFVDDMKVEPDAIVWRALLGACRIHGNVELGEHANKQLLKLRGGSSGDYVLLSNIYASMGKWGGKEKIRKLMDDRRVSKEAGCSQIEGKNKEFISFLLQPTSKHTSSVIAEYLNKC
ncbi:hypothetical protein J5N97_005793 [Dioscorea zingiberensis]|uniref:Pentatricopeptide repeat-containing protein n=1 Tax=Dioscorea zingiberensis TaxID=325984 RepID=A0A9D5HTD3_9LILI|nr:hypothetical protein J5N97_005793 [Dioscorea zingiberensis]